MRKAQPDKLSKRQVYNDRLAEKLYKVTLPITDPSKVRLGDPDVEVVLPNRALKGHRDIIKTRTNRDGVPVWTILQLADIWQVSRRRVIAAINGEPVEYREDPAPFATNTRSYEKRPRVRTVVVRGDVADRIYKEKIKPTLNVR